MPTLRFASDQDLRTWMRAKGLGPQLANLPPKQAGSRPVATEHEEQAALLQWVRYYKKIVPQLGLLFAIANGGLRHVVVAKKLQAEGVQSGVPDLCLPVARCGWHALYIEMKAQNGKLSANQQQWRRLLIAEGNKVETCYDWTAARDALLAYLRKETVKVITNGKGQSL